MAIKKTINSIFMVPTLGINREGLINNQFINGYQWDINREIKHENSVSLLFKPKNMPKFKDFLDNEYERSEDIIEDYDTDGFVVVVYSLNREFEKDFELIKQGKYSRTSSKFQDLFPRTLKIIKQDENKRNSVKEEESLQYRIFNKTEDMKEYWEDRIAINFKEDMEVWSTYEETKEVLDVSKIKELI